MHLRKKVIIVILSLLFLSPVAVAAEEKIADNMQFVLEKIQTDKKLFIAQNMQLTEPEAVAFWPIYAHYQDELFLLRARFLNLVTNYADVYNTMTDANAKLLLEEFLTIEGLGLKLRQVYLPKFESVLPSIKVVRYFQIENKVNIALMYQIAARIPFIKENRSKKEQ